MGRTLGRTLTAGVVAAAFAASSPIVAQPTQPPSASAEAPLIGLAVYSSDGQRLGEVTHASMDGDPRRFRQLPRHRAGCRNQCGALGKALEGPEGQLEPAKQSVALAAVLGAPQGLCARTR